MSGGFSNPILGGGGGLVYPSIHSPNFNVANPSASPNPSWGILKNGLAYFFGLILAGGTITGPDYIFNSNGFFFYNGAPANGNLIASITATNGTDGFLNPYGIGFVSYIPGVSNVAISGALINFANAAGSMFIEQVTAGGLEITGTAGVGFLDVAVPLSVALNLSQPGAASLGTAEVWHTVTPPTGLSGTLRYRATIDGQVDVQCFLTVANTVAAGTITLITLPAAYTPTTTARGPVAYFTNGQTTVAEVLGLLNMRWSANPAGTVTVQAFAGGAATTGVTELDFTARFPLT